MQNPVKAVQTYFRSAWAEIKKVTWPSREMTIRYSAIVIMVSLAVAAFFATLDFAFGRLVTTAITQVKGGAGTELPEQAEPITPTTEPVDFDIEGEGASVQVEPVGSESGEAIDAGALDLDPSSIEGSGDAPLDNGSLELPPIE